MPAGSRNGCQWTPAERRDRPLHAICNFPILFDFELLSSFTNISTFQCDETHPGMRMLQPNTILTKLSALQSAGIVIRASELAPATIHFSDLKVALKVYTLPSLKIHRQGQPQSHRPRKPLVIQQCLPVTRPRRIQDTATNLPQVIHPLLPQLKITNIRPLSIQRSQAVNRPTWQCQD